MHKVYNGERNVIILDSDELRQAEAMALAASAVKAGDAVNAGEISIHAEGDDYVVTGIVGAKVSQLRTKKSLAEICEAVAAYRTADRVLAVLA